jgi:hypothetical protein
LATVLVTVLAEGWAVPLAGSGSRPLGEKADAGAAGAIGKRGGAAAWSVPPPFWGKGDGYRKCAVNRSPGLGGGWGNGDENRPSSDS